MGREKKPKTYTGMQWGERVRIGVCNAGNACAQKQPGGTQSPERRTGGGTDTEDAVVVVVVVVVAAADASD